VNYSKKPTVEELADNLNQLILKHNTLVEAVAEMEKAIQIMNEGIFSIGVEEIKKFDA
jgi:hypothetical protein